MKRITAKTIVELKAKVYEAQGWVRVEGESMMHRIQNLYTVRIDQKKNKFVAIPKNPKEKL